LHIIPAKPKPVSETDAAAALANLTDEQKRNMSFKQKKELMLKANASKPDDSWNTLFIRSDTVRMEVRAAACYLLLLYGCLRPLSLAGRSHGVLCADRWRMRLPLDMTSPNPTS